MSVCVTRVCEARVTCPFVRNFDAKYRVSKRFKGLCPTGTLYESAYGVSIGDVINDVTLLCGYYYYYY